MKKQEIAEITLTSGLSTSRNELPLKSGNRRSPPNESTWDKETHEIISNKLGTSTVFSVKNYLSNRKSTKRILKFKIVTIFARYLNGCMKNRQNCNSTSELKYSSDR